MASDPPLELGPLMGGRVSAGQLGRRLDPLVVVLTC